MRLDYWSSSLMIFLLLKRRLKSDYTWKSGHCSGSFSVWPGLCLYLLCSRRGKGRASMHPSFLMSLPLAGSETRSRSDTCPGWALSGSPGTCCVTVHFVVVREEEPGRRTCQFSTDGELQLGRRVWRFLPKPPVPTRTAAPGSLSTVRSPDALGF